MSAEARSRSIWALALLAVVVATGAYLHAWLASPRYVDYDSATQAIFVNDISFGDRYDHIFAGSDDFQDQYRSWWAAQVLPQSVLMSAVQRIAGIEAFQVDRLVLAMNLFFGLVGSLCFALAIGTRRRLGQTLFAVALLACLPPFYLVLRTTGPSYLWAFALFWLCMLAFLRFASSGRPGWLYLLPPLLALFALQPYPPLLVLPVAFVLILAMRGELGRVLRGRHVYLAATATVVAWLLLSLGLGLTYEGSLSAYWDRIAQLVEVRPGSISLANARLELLPEKLTKLLHQHVTFTRDDLGDPSRSDDLWTLGAMHLTWLLLIPFGLAGLVDGLRRRDLAVQVCAAVTLTSLLLALTLSYPEGRYVLIILPCYALFVGRGLARAVAWRSSSARVVNVVLALALLAHAANTTWLVRTQYEPFGLGLSAHQAGIREAVAELLPLTEAGDEVFLVLPGHDKKRSLVASMYAGGKLESLGPLGLFEEFGTPPAAKPGHAAFILVEAGDETTLSFCRGQGFESYCELTELGAGRHFELLRLR